MIHIAAKERYEIEGKTVLYVPEERLTHEEYAKLLNGDKFTFSARNENNGNRDEEGKFFTKYIGRNICIPTKVKRLYFESTGEDKKPNGYYIYLELDVEHLPTTQRKLNAGSNLSQTQ